MKKLNKSRSKWCARDNCDARNVTTVQCNNSNNNTGDNSSATKNANGFVLMFAFGDGCWLSETRSS